ncbi:uncharacterized protein LOC115990365 [Quercus lobata]|uniref:uncharacterized protein LOC115990365 n=1 Tax=Quercus lobata TaxID=97700 RepID=UPI0012465637|nr:uncharacterized protein LOC115990365 [Quercus lobata]
MDLICIYGGENGVADISGRMRRSFLEESNTEVEPNATLILAANKTHRIDPFANFTYYEGGWNITNEHYLYSVAYTGVPLLATAATWFLIFGLCSLILCCCCCCRRQKKSYGYSRIAYALSLILLILFSITAITGSGFLYTAQGKFQVSTTNILEYLLNQADTTVEKLKDVLVNLVAAKEVGVGQNFLPPDIQSNIDILGNMTNISAMIPKIKTQQSSKQIQNVLLPVRQVLNIIAASMLLLALLGFMFSVFGLQCFVYILMIIGWILVTGTFILCGISLVLHNIVADTCVSMDQWVENPTAHSALSEVLPCMDNATANDILSISKHVTFLMVGIVNQFITNVANNDVPPNAGPFYYNQSGPLVPILCNPLNFDNTDRRCTAGEMDLSNATQVWGNYVCNVLPSGMCTSMGRLTPTSYGQMQAAVNVSYTLYHYGPFLVDLVDCNFVRETFSDISEDHCPGLRRYSYRIYVGLVMVSAAVMLSMIFWLVYARERRHRVYAKKFTPKIYSQGV